MLVSERGAGQALFRSGHAAVGGQLTGSVETLMEAAEVKDSTA